MMANKKQNNSMPLTQSHTGSNPFDTLTDDIIVDILNRLPYKSLLQYMTVSKTWLDLIANPKRPNSCRSLRLKANPSPLVGFFIRVPPCLEWTNTDPSTPHCYPSFLNYDLDIVTSSNGCILFHNWRKSGRETHYIYTYYVANPFTNQRIELPPVHLLDIYGFPAGFTCRADQSPAHFMVVLSYIDSHNKEEKCQHVKFFSSFENDADVPQWKDICLEYSGGLQYYRNESRAAPVFELSRLPAAVLRDRVFFWINYDWDQVVSIDLNKGQYWAMDVPSPRSVHGQDIGMLVFEDRLYCAKQSLTYYADVEVWVYEGDLFRYDSAGRWVFQYVVNVQDLERRFPNIMPRDEASDHGNDEYGVPRAYFVWFHPCDPGIVFFNVDKKLISYEVQSRRLLEHGVGNVNCMPCEWRPWPHSLPLLKLDP